MEAQLPVSHVRCSSERLSGLTIFMWAPSSTISAPSARTLERMVATSATGHLTRFQVDDDVGIYPGLNGLFLPILRRTKVSDLFLALALDLPLEVADSLAQPLDNFLEATALIFDDHVVIFREGFPKLINFCLLVLIDAPQLFDLGQKKSNALGVVLF